MQGPSIDREPSSKLVGLEIIRALAAIEVLVAHLGTKIPNGSVHLLGYVGDYATEAVVAFFVLSGVVISLHPHSNARAFIRARIVRIVPIYLCALMLAYLCGALYGQRVSLSTAIGHLLFLQDLSGFIVAPPEFNQALWSLAYEMTYYMIAPLVIMGAGSVTKALTAFGTCLAAGLWLSGAHLVPGPLSHFLTVLSWYPMWLLGNLCVTAYRRGVRIGPATALFGFGLGIVFSRVPLSNNFYDVFRLTAFSGGIACLCLLILQRGQGGEREFPFWGRLVASVIALALLWQFSHSHVSTKLLITSAMGMLLFGPLVMKSPHHAMTLISKSGAAALLYIASISYAIYAVHLPILFLVSLTALSTAFKICTILAIIVPVAHVLERWMQPVLKRLISNTLRTKASESIQHGAYPGSHG